MANLQHTDLRNGKPRSYFGTSSQVLISLTKIWFSARKQRAAIYLYHQISSFLSVWGRLVLADWGLLKFETFLKTPVFTHDIWCPPYSSLDKWINDTRPKTLHQFRATGVYKCLREPVSKLGITWDGGQSLQNAFGSCNNTHHEEYYRMDVLELNFKN